MSNATFVKENEPQKLTCMADMKRMVQNAIKENNLDKKKATQYFGLKRYEK